MCLMHLMYIFLQLQELTRVRWKTNIRRQAICCLLQPHNRTQVKNSNILTKAPKKQRHQKQKQSQTLEGRNSICHGRAASYKREKSNAKIFSIFLEPQCQNLLLIYPLSMVYKKASLEIKNALGEKDTPMQEN